jgi:hypothetical protein
MGNACSCNVPPVQLMNKILVLRGKNPQQMDKKHFPNADLELMQEIYYKCAENVEAQRTEAIYKRILWNG